MNHPEIYRKRLIPEEIVHLKDDIILECNEDRIVTKWNTLKPKKEIARGFSCYCLKEGWKISKLLDTDDRLVTWYCDIMDYTYEESSNSLITLDLLADVLIRPDGTVRIVDLDELSEVLQFGRLEVPLVSACLTRLNTLLNAIDSGEFTHYQEYLSSFS